MKKWLQKILRNTMGKPRTRPVLNDTIMYKVMTVGVKAPEEYIKRYPLIKLRQIKSIDILVTSKEKHTEARVETYISDITGIKFAFQESDIKYGSLGYLYFRNGDFMAIIVDTFNLKMLPRRYRTKEWQFVRIHTSVNDNRFDKFPFHNVVLAYDYNIR